MLELVSVDFLKPQLAGALFDREILQQSNPKSYISCRMLLSVPSFSFMECDKCACCLKGFRLCYHA